MAKRTKPREDFPLTPRSDGRWCKRVHGKYYYFTGEPDEALRQYHELLERLGKEESGEWLVRDLCNAFMDQKDADLEAGHITKRSHATNEAMCDLIVRHFGKLRPLSQLGPSDAEDLRAVICRGLGPHTQNTRIATARAVFNYATDHELMARPFARWIKRVPHRVIRKHQSQQPDRLLSPDQLRLIIDQAEQPLQSMILLAINCGFGNHDCGDICLSDIDLAGGWHSFPRPKTGEPRRAKLWPETVASILESIRRRPKPRQDDYATRLFLTRQGRPYVIPDRTHNALGEAYRIHLKAIDLYQPGRSFYSLRHQFATVAGNSRDQVAVNLVMGHRDPSISASYRHDVDDERLEAVAAYVRTWLLGDDPGDDLKLRVVG